MLKRLIRCLAALGMACVLTACAAYPPEVVDHAFGFDTRHDDQDADVLDYRYGDSRLPVRAPEAAVRAGNTFAFNSVQGPLLRGDSLYVKWRNGETGLVYEDTVDLRERMPANIADHKIYFMVKGPQLYVYLIALKERRPPAMPRTGPALYDHLKTIRIYPDQPKP